MEVLVQPRYPFPFSNSTNSTLLGYVGEYDVYLLNKPEQIQVEFWIALTKGVHSGEVVTGLGRQLTLPRPREIPVRLHNGKWAKGSVTSNSIGQDPIPMDDKAIELALKYLNLGENAVGDAMERLG